MKLDRCVARAIGVETPPPLAVCPAGAGGTFLRGFGISVSATLRNASVVPGFEPKATE
jgi:hypothetical protein